MTVSDYLRERPRAVTYRVLCCELGLSRRQVEAEIQRLRLEGCPIITSQDGAEWTEDPARLEECADRLRGRIAAQAVTVAALEKAAERLRGTRQARLFW